MKPRNAPVRRRRMRTVPRAPAQTEEERIRRFMEALGVPTSNAPIPKAEVKREQPKPAAPPKPKVAPIDPFPRGGFPFPPVANAPSAPSPFPQQPPLTPPPPRVPAAPSPMPVAPPPLPTRETTMFTPAAPAEFAVQDVTEAVDDLPPVRGGKAGTQKREAVPELTLAARLRSPQALRDAIVLREIFGPPRSMQPAELTRA